MQDAPQTAQETSAKSSLFYTEYYGAVFLALIALFVLNAFFILKPMIDDIKETNAETRAEVESAASEQAYLNSLEQSIAAAQAISPSVLERVNQALPLEANTPVLLVELGSIAHTNGVQIASIAFAENKLSAGGQTGALSSVVPIDISLTVNARSYFDFKRFLADIESSLRIVDVLSMSTQGGEATIGYTMQMRSYAFAQQHL